MFSGIIMTTLQKNQISEYMWQCRMTNVLDVQAAHCIL